MTHHMRTALVGVLVLGLCTAFTPAAVGATAPPPRYGGHLVTAFLAKPSSLDPARTNAPGYDASVFNVLYNRLVRPGRDGAPSPDLAVSWKVAKDGRSIEFALRRGVTFHDGTPFDAAAVKFNLDRIIDPTTVHTGRTYFEDIQSIDVVDPGTVRVNLKEPSAQIMAGLMFFPGYIASPAAVRKYGADYQLHPAGTGPFMLKEWVPGDRVHLVRNESYWEKDEAGRKLPYLDEITMRVIPEDSVRYVEIRSGTVQVVDRVPAQNLQEVLKDRTMQYVDTPTTVLSMLVFNMATRRSIFADDPNLRLAVAHAIDREGILKTVFLGEGYIAPFIYTKQEFGYRPDGGIPYNLAMAKDFLKKSRYDGRPVVLSTIAREPDRQLAQVVQAQLGAIGMNIQLEVLERLAFVDKASKLNFEFGMVQGTFPLPSAYLALDLHMGGGASNRGFATPLMRRLLKKLRTSFTPEETKKTMSDIQDYVLQMSPRVFIVHRTYGNVVRRNVNGFKNEFHGVWDLSRVWLDRR
jgi:peptide/nickel transport system substrate-binding protein